MTADTTPLFIPRHVIENCLIVAAGRYSPGEPPFSAIDSKAFQSFRVLLENGYSIDTTQPLFGEDRWGDLMGSLEHELEDAEGDEIFSQMTSMLREMFIAGVELGWNPPNLDPMEYPLLTGMPGADIQSAIAEGLHKRIDVATPEANRIARPGPRL